MTPVEAYFLGLFTVLIILVPFWLLAYFIPTVATYYTRSVCYNVCP